jgi:PIN like domain
MKKAFVGYYTPSETEFTDLWTTGRIVLDANVLLAVYGVSPSTRDTLLGLLEKVKERLWIPNHFALEYQRKRLGKILEQIKHYEDARRTLQAILDGQFRSKTQHPFVGKEVETGLEEICKKLLDGKTEQEELLTLDPHFLKTTELFDGNVGAPYNENDLNRAYEVARKRFDEKVPPGFKDSDKPEPARYGDYVGWRQILDFAVKNNASVILVTDDAKDDWWRREGAQTFGPRPELVVEFRTSCSGLFYMYSSDRFLELSGKYIGGPVDPTAINELKKRRESNPTSDINKPSVIPISATIAFKPNTYIPDSEINLENQNANSPKPIGDAIQKAEEK